MRGPAARIGGAAGPAFSPLTDATGKHSPVVWLASVVRLELELDQRKDREQSLSRVLLAAGAGPRQSRVSLLPVRWPPIFLANVLVKVLERKFSYSSAVLAILRLPTRFLTKRSPAAVGYPISPAPSDTGPGSSHREQRTRSQRWPIIYTLSLANGSANRIVM